MNDQVIAETTYTIASQLDLPSLYMTPSAPSVRKAEAIVAVLVTKNLLNPEWSLNDLP